MSRLNWLQKIYWTQFAKPVEDRELYRVLVRNPVRSILEVGLGNGQRMRRIGKLWRNSARLDKYRFIGTDEFEAATDSGRHLRLKQAHQLASRLGLHAILIPGDTESAIPRVAHKTGPVDLIIADGQLDPELPFEGVVGSWLNHLAHEQTFVLACSRQGEALSLVDWQLAEQNRQAA